MSGMFTHEIEESILIDAPPTEVWSILTDLASWSDWNTFVIKAEVQPPHDRLAVAPPPLRGPRGRVGELRWGGAWLHALVLDTQHWCLVQPEGEDGRQTLFTQGELFSGLMVPVTRAMGLFEQLRTGYDRMNEDLRRRAEGDGGDGGGVSEGKY
ncbi:hypothetical protein PG997_011906 [Apiospora hydei]|uniref:Polyketide cyclase/dehydrase n=1 Tax=Apiospora hydei TaxID=1337664 RepID=A0ABR1V1U8_9PEZI